MKINEELKVCRETNSLKTNRVMDTNCELVSIQDGAYRWCRDDNLIMIFKKNRLHCESRAALLDLREGHKGKDIYALSGFEVKEIL